MTGPLLVYEFQLFWVHYDRELFNLFDSIKDGVDLFFDNFTVLPAEVVSLGTQMIEDDRRHQQTPPTLPYFSSPAALAVSPSKKGGEPYNFIS